MTLFVTGVTGYIGGSFAAEAVRRGYRVRGLVRSPEKFGLCEAYGIEPVLGTLSDYDILIRETRAADAVINAASSDNRPAIDAILSALSNSGKILLHTSGSSIVADDARGGASDVVFDELHLPAPQAEKRARVALDQAILAAPGLRSVILCNSLIFGNTLGPKAQSVQLPLLIKQAQETGVAHYIGEGLNRWSTVHISDVIDLYFIALEKASSSGFVFVESGESSFRDMAYSISAGLHQHKPMPLSLEAAIAKWGAPRARYSLASNSRVRSLYTREWGWSPQQTDVHAWILSHLNESVNS